MGFKVAYVFVWCGNPPKCKTVRDGIIIGQDVFQDELVDPVIGHLWDLNKDKCLVHDRCDCKLSVMMLININLVSDVDGIRSYSKTIKEAYDKRRQG